MRGGPVGDARERDREEAAGDDRPQAVPEFGERSASPNAPTRGTAAEGSSSAAAASAGQRRTSGAPGSAVASNRHARQAR